MQGVRRGGTFWSFARRPAGRSAPKDALDCAAGRTSMTTKLGPTPDELTEVTTSRERPGFAPDGAAIEHGSSDAGSADQAARSEHGQVLADRSGCDSEALGECAGQVRFVEGSE